jgi:hypothetical protein
MTLLVYFHCNHYRPFKHYDTEYVEPHLRPYFPQLVSYTRSELTQLFSPAPKQAMPPVDL